MKEVTKGLTTSTSVIPAPVTRTQAVVTEPSFGISHSVMYLQSRALGAPGALLRAAP